MIHKEKRNDLGRRVLMPRHLPCVRPINTLAIVICNHYHCPCFVRIDSIRFSRSPRARWPAALPGVSPVRREEVYYASPSTVSTADFEELSGSPRWPPRCAAPRGAGCILYANPGAGARGDPEVFQKKGAPGGRRRGKPSLPAAVAPTPSGAYVGPAGRPAAAQDGRAAARGMGRDRVPPLRGAADPLALARQAGWGRRGRGSDEFGPYATRPSRKPSVAGAAGQLSAARVARRFSERSVVQRIARLRRIGLKRRLPERLVVQAIRTMRFRERWQSPPSTKAARKRGGAGA